MSDQPANPLTAEAAPQVLFIHVMKTGGTSLLWHIRRNFGVDEVYPQDGVDLEYDGSKPRGQRVGFRHNMLGYLGAIPEARRRQIRVFTGHFPFLAADVLGGKVLTITILREPIGRTISHLRQWCRNRPQEGLSLEQAYDQPHVFQRLLHNHQTKLFSLTHEDAPPSYIKVIDVDESRLALAKQNLQKVDIVGLTERYGDLLDLVGERLGWQVERDIRANTSPDDDTSDISDSFRDRIAEDNAIDLAFYAYAQDLVEARRTDTS